MRRALVAAMFALCAVLAAAPAAAVDPDEILADPALEDRARDISAQLRCLVCQNQSIDDSNAPLAKDLRVLVRERIEAGDDDGEIIDFVVARYGEFVLLSPRVAPHTLALWAGPPLLFVIGAIVVFFSLRRRRASPVTPLSSAEEEKLEHALGDRH